MVCFQTTYDRVPLLSIINAAVKPWLHSYLDSAGEALSKEIETSTPLADHNMYANRALIRGRSGDGNLALEDAEKVTFNFPFQILGLFEYKTSPSPSKGLQ